MRNILILALIAVASSCSSTTPPVVDPPKPFSIVGNWILETNTSGSLWFYTVDFFASSTNQLLTGKTRDLAGNLNPLVDGVVTTSETYPKNLSFTFEIQDNTSPCVSTKTGAKVNYVYYVSGSLTDKNNFLGTADSKYCNRTTGVIDLNQFIVKMRREFAQ